MNEDDLKQQIKSSMDQLTQEIDVSTQVKLNEIRHAALNQPKKKFNRPLMWSLTTMAAAVVMVVGLMVTSQEVPMADSPELALFSDLDLLANEADAEFYQDIEFLTWLDEGNWQESDI